jgi:Protein of unknown function (DUF2911)
MAFYAILSFIFLKNYFSLMKKIILFLFVAFSLNIAQAQITTPQASPGATIMQKVGLVDVKIEYFRPSLKGRKMFGTNLPYGQMWRTGANGGTKITVSDDVTIAGNKLAKGTYSIFTIPNEKEWTVMFSKNLTRTGNGDKDYKPEEDAIKFMAKTEKVMPAVESMTFNISDLKDASATIELLWENTKIAFPIVTDADTKVMADIKRTMEGPSGNDMYNAAVYYLNNGKDLTQAYAWMNKAIEKNGEKFWMLRQKSLIEAGLGKFKDAIATATKSKEMATKEGNAEYVKMNETSMMEWMKK